MAPKKTKKRADLLLAERGLAESREQAQALIMEGLVYEPAGRVLKDYLDELRHVAPDLKGGDLLALGVPEGPLVGQILGQLREAKLDRRLATSAQEQRLVKELLAQWGGQPGRG